MKALFGGIAATVSVVAPLVAATPARLCPSSANGVCYSVGVPEVTASSGSGSLYFQISAPTSYSWVALGTGTRMAGAEMFIMYTDGSGNVTISPRTASGHSQPSFTSSIQVELLAGSGVSGNTMTGNFRATGLDIDAAASSSPFIAAWRTGSPLDSSSPSASISQHNSYAGWSFDLQQATITSDTNPFVSSSGDNNGDTTNGGNTGTDTTSGSENNNNNNNNNNGNSGVVGEGGEISGAPSRTLLYIHAIIASVVFVILMPFFSLLMPLLGKWYIHAGLQVFAFIAMWVAFGLGVRVANDYGIIFQQTHTILGTVVICALVLQPVFGWLHHKHYVKHQGRGVISYVHIWYGRILIILAIINGGLGLQLAAASNAFKIAYSAVAGFMFVVYVIVKIGATMRKSRMSYKRGAMKEPGYGRRRPYEDADEAAWQRQQAQHQAPIGYEGHRHEGTPADYHENRYA